ncbi:hypothetical protein KW792_01495 [Candidatus Saccharibacteria bacterium]|nr:hypothetical protein [Candidatus Saccharibacteria bacterium]
MPQLNHPRWFSALSPHEVLPTPPRRRDGPIPQHPDFRQGAGRSGQAPSGVQVARLESSFTQGGHVHPPATAVPPEVAMPYLIVTTNLEPDESVFISFYNRNQEEVIRELTAEAAAVFNKAHGLKNATGAQLKISVALDPEGRPFDYVQREQAIAVLIGRLNLHYRERYQEPQNV